MTLTTVTVPNAPAATEPPAHVTPHGVATRLPALERRWTLRRTRVPRAGAPSASPQQGEAVSSVAAQSEALASCAGLEAALKLPPSLCRLLLVRGFADESDARQFLKPRLERLHDPSLLAGMGAAVERVRRALRDGETILVHGDYDVDGICGATLCTRALAALGARVRTFVPHRLRDGYDLTGAGVRAAADAGASLILTVDCGTVAHEPIAAAAAAGIDVIVTDHHTPSQALPPALAVVNPNRPDCTYPDKGLAGAGVAFKLCQALAAAEGADPAELWSFLDLVAVATIADLAPLAGENRILTRFGLRLLRQTRNPGLRALLESAKIDTTEPIGAGKISHVLAPRINAAGRVGDAARAIELLMTADEREAGRLAHELEQQNETRRAVDRETLAQAVDMLERDYDPARDFAIVLAAHGWHPGVIGIVASRVVELTHRPTVLIAIDDDGRARGSARSIPRFHLYEGIRACAHLLERYGGHRQAAGLEIRPERIPELRAALNDHARTVLRPHDLEPTLRIDLDIHLSEITTELFALMRHFGPFGIGNPMPVLGVRDVRVARPPRTVGAGHVRLVLEQDGARLQAIGFGMADRIATLDAVRNRLDVVFHLQEDRWNAHLQAKLIDVRIAR